MKRLLLCACSLVAAGCYDDDPTLSSDIATADMSVYFQIAGDASSLHVDLSFTGPGGHVIFDGGDEVRLLSNGEAQTATQTNDGLRYNLDPHTDSLAVTLDRPEPWTSTDVSLPLPAYPDLQAAPSWVRSDPYLIRWNAENEDGYSVQVLMQGDCLSSPLTVPVAVGTGKLIIYPSDLAGATDEACEVTITLSRTILFNLYGTELSSAAAWVQLSYDATVTSTP